MKDETSPVARLPVEQLRRRCDPDTLGFESTEDAEPLEVVLGQDRAVAAIKFAIGIDHEGYNLFALGPSGVGKLETTLQYLRPVAAARPVSSEWCYVNNFADPEKPIALELPPGRASELRAAMARLILDLQVTLPVAFESEDYAARKQSIEDELRDRQQRAFKELRGEAQDKDLIIMRTPTGVILAPKREGEVLSPDALAELTDDERDQIEADIESLQGKLKDRLKLAPRWEREQREKLGELNREVTTFAVADLIERPRDQFRDLPQVVDFLDAVQDDLVDNVDRFLGGLQRDKGDGEGRPSMAALQAAVRKDSFASYRVNVLVERDGDGAPVVFEDNPSLSNLVGRIDRRSQFGFIYTDFSLIRPGTLHRANGGYLIMDAAKVLTQPFAWEQLKRALRAKKVRVDALSQTIEIGPPISLEPQPIPLDVRIVLLGEPWLYYMLSAADPEFSELFKVAADFETRIDRDEVVFARMLARLVSEAELRPFDKTAIARVIEHCGRMADDTEKLSTHMETIVDLLRESDHWAGQEGRVQVTAEDVKRAVEAQKHREGRLRDLVQEQIVRELILIDTEGEAVGQINGLSVLQIGRTAFGKPTRITARVRPGRGSVVDIEREVKLGGPLHSKGVLILTGFLGSRYAPQDPLALSASLVFEQSYGGVDGDSASLAETCALLSAIAKVPIQQRWSVTGSVNQRGSVQAIGGVNEKIEGFFDICDSRGLSGDQGVIIPASNAKHLMLRDDVVAAAADGRFQIVAVGTVDEALSLLTGQTAGERAEDGLFPEGTFNRAVEDRIAELAELARRFASGAGDNGEEGGRG